jgi:hypothetical protein
MPTTAVLSEPAKAGGGTANREASVATAITNMIAREPAIDFFNDLTPS